MSLHDSDAMDIEASGAAESLPDPAAVAGRTYNLFNNANVVQTWTTAGAGFVVGGVNAANLVLPVGSTARIYSNGSRWVVIGIQNRKIVAAKAVTDANGDAVFSFPAGFFSANPVVTVANETANGTSIIDLRITNLTPTSCTVRARQSVPVVLLAVSVYALAGPLVGSTIDLIAVEAGTTP